MGNATSTAEDGDQDMQGMVRGRSKLNSEERAESEGPRERGA